MNLPTVHIVDDDDAVRDSLKLLCKTSGLKVKCYNSAEAFLSEYHPGQPGCLILDVCMGRTSGPELHAELRRRGSHLSIIYLTAHGNIPMTVKAMKAGAVDFLTKPVDGSVLLDRVQAALQQSVDLMSQQAEAEDLRQRLALLTPREYEILKLALAGHANKIIARQLGISHRTVEIHRSSILRKTGAANLMALAQIAADGGPLLDHTA